MAELFAEVAFNIALDRTFTYRVPPRLAGQVAPGKRLRAPFHGREITGFCVALADSSPVEKTLDIADVLDAEPLIAPQMLKLTKWIADYYCCGWGQALEAAVPSGVKRAAEQRTETIVHLSIGVADIHTVIEDLEKRSPKQAHVVEILSTLDHEASLQELCRLAECTRGPVGALRRKNIVKFVHRIVTDDPLLSLEAKREPPLKLEPPQEAALNQILTLVKHRSGVILVHGVTGSGKTEIYLQAIEKVVAAGQQAIVLVPEIALTPQTVRRFKARFDHVAVLHSHLTESQRHEQWREIRSGKTQVVVGVRSAIFAPTPRLGLIVVDEESDTSFKQDSVPRYNGRDVAIMRGKIENAVVVLGSATPALESWYNARASKYELASLHGRVEGRPLPRVEIVDMRKEMAAVRQFRFLSRRLVALMEERLARDEQVILFLNRRGFSTYVFCGKCGWALKCRHCDISMTFHKRMNRAICHYCGERSHVPETCPDCQGETIKHIGLGTEKVEDEIRARFPAFECARMDSDSVRGRGSHARVLDAFRAGRVKILVGTKMIAKGLDFPNVTLVGVVDADTSLHLPDFRAGERTHQLIAQVAGRTGRGPKGGMVIVQTHSPDHYTIKTAANHDFPAFAAIELEHRRALHMPPFARTARIVVDGREEAAVRKAADAIGDALAAAAAEQKAVVLGPAPCPLERIKDRFRWHVLILAGKWRSLRDMIKAAEPAMPDGRKVHAAVDVDPAAML